MKKLLAILLSVVMVMSLCAFTASADDVTEISLTKPPFPTCWLTSTLPIPKSRSMWNTWTTPTVTTR